jgi:hypothetical protein
MSGDPSTTVEVNESRSGRANRGAKPGERRGGRQKGTPNKVSVEFRETVQKLLDDNRENVSLWLDRVARLDPGKALDLVAKLAEFAAPKLSRAEVTGPGGKDLVPPSVTVTLVKPK